MFSGLYPNLGNVRIWSRMTDPRPPRHSSSYLEGVARLVEQLPAVVWTTDRQLRISSFAGRSMVLAGLDASQVLGTSLYEFFQTDDRTHPGIAAHLGALDGVDETYDIKFRGHDFACRVAPLRADDFSIEGCIGLGVDVSDVKRAEEALKRSEAHYRALVEDAPVGIFRSSAAGRFLVVNSSLVKMLGYATPAELLGLDMAADVYVDPKLRGTLIARYESLERVAGVDVDWRRKDGSRITVRLSGQPVRDAGGAVSAWEMVAEDVTERRRLEAQLHTAQKMEALGLVTGGVAHDFNNLLTTILANAELIGAALPASLGEIRSDLLEIRDAAARGGDLVKKLLGFSRRERLLMQPTDVGQLVLEMADVLPRLMPERITVAVDADDDLPPVLADTGALQQIILNLATNARDAIAGHGTIRIRALRAGIDAAHLAEYGWGAVGDYVAIRVEDTGLGMDEETRARVFEPFFTTKPPGEGSGLGLAMVYGLMKQQNGWVGIASRPNEGTTVTLYLPITVRRGTPKPQKAVRETGGETILVVEDEEPIRRVARRVLERHGYRVLTAADGLDALAVYREHEREIALVLSDMVMPRMGGKALYDTLRSAGKPVPVVFMSGYTSRGGDIELAELPPDMEILAKPWSVDQLIARVRETLGRTV